MADETTRLGALTSRDLNALATESGQLDSYPTRGFQDFLVTLPTSPDFPFEIEHTLSPALPTGVRYEVLQATYPTVLYHNPDDQWDTGYVVLRATAGDGAQIRIRLTVDDGDAEPFLEGNISEGMKGFQVEGPLGSLSVAPWHDDSSLGLDMAAGFALAQNASHDGPAVQLGDDAAGMGWQISADMGGYSAGIHRLRFIPTSESSAKRYAAQISQDPTSVVAGDYYLTGGPGGNKLYLGAPSGSGFGAGFRITNLYASAADVAGTVTLQNIQLPATQVASADANNLDDYEEGTFTPTLTGSGGASGVTYTTQTGYYVKVGQNVFCGGRITLSNKGTITGNVRIGGLPFTSITTANFYAMVNIGFFQNLTTPMYFILGYQIPNTTQIELIPVTAAATSQANTIVAADISNTFDFIFSITYRASA